MEPSEPSEFSTKQIGSELEAAVAARVLAEGYQVTLNAFVVGRSGSTHEIDVLAVRTDGVAQFKLAIECKAWQSQVDKDVIAKAHYVAGDIDADKVMVVSSGGFTPGAVSAGAALRVELWGPAEIDAELATFRNPRVSARSLQGVETGSTQILGFPLSIDEAQLEQWVQKRTKAGFRQKSVYLRSRLLIPCYQVGITFTVPKRFGRSTAESRYFWLELLGGEVIETHPIPMAGQPMALGPNLQDWTDGQATESLMNRLSELSDPDIDGARRKQIAKIFGMPSLIGEFSFGSLELFYIEVYLVVLRKGALSEVAVLRGLDLREWTYLEDVLTKNLAKFLAEAGPMIATQPLI